MFSGLLLLAAVAIISWEALQRFLTPVEPVGQTIMAVAGIGVVINAVTAWFFISGKDHDLTIQGGLPAHGGRCIGIVRSGCIGLCYLAFRPALAQQLQEWFEISHATFQVERDDLEGPCLQSPNCAT